MKKNLVLYFSVYSSTQSVAKEIAKQTGADIIEIEPMTAYDSNRDNYNKLAAYAKKEHDENMRPEIKNEIPISEYENIFLGYPMWWYTFPMIIYTLFDKYDFAGKNIIPFNTHMGSKDGGTYATIKQLAPDANVFSGLPIDMKTAENGAEKQISQWLKMLNI